METQLLKQTKKLDADIVNTCKTRIGMNHPIFRNMKLLAFHPVISSYNSLFHIIQKTLTQIKHKCLNDFKLTSKLNMKIIKYIQ